MKKRPVVFVACVDCGVKIRRLARKERCTPCAYERMLWRQRRHNRARYQRLREQILAQQAAYHRAHQSERRARAERHYLNRKRRALDRQRKAA